MCQYRGSGAALIVVAMLGGCKDGGESQTATPKPPEVTVSPVVDQEVTDYAEFTGRLEATATVDVRARVRGYLNEIFFTDGQEVKEGDPLFQIDPAPFDAALKSAEGQKAQWVAKQARAQADVKRYEELVPTGAATPQDLDKSKADLGEATAAIQSAEAAIDQANLDLKFARITAPISGQIGRSLVDRGNLIQGGTANVELLTTIVSLDPVYVYFDVDERTLLRFRENARSTRPPTASQPDVKELKIPLYLGLATEEGFPHQGVIDFSDNRVDPSTGTIKVRGVFDNSKRIFKPGLFARVRLPLSEPYQAVLVAERAIGTDQGVKYVLVVDDKNMVERRFVKPGALQDDGLRVIAEGLKPGERIVVNGLQRARPGKPVTPTVEEMPRHPGDIRVAAAVQAPKASADESNAEAGH